ncbi:MAG: signal peptidase II [Clostridia bacterium]|nr:signal peptidase II [Clostridia bacterium]
MAKNFFDKRKKIILAINAVTAALLIFFDQMIKIIVDKNIEYSIESIPVIDNFFSIVHWHNTGGAWGLMSDYTWVLTALTITACVVFVYLIICSKATLSNISLVLVLSGAVGNVIDRIRLGYVIDYLNFYNLFGYSFPAFNLADICVVSGCIGLILCVIFCKTPMFEESTLVGRLLSDKKDGEDSDRK